MDIVQSLIQFTMKVLFLFAILSYAKADVASCKILKNIYEAFECIPRCIDAATSEPTKYSCLKSPYVINYSLDTCYFQGKVYSMDEVVTKPYPNPEGTYNCSYKCVGSYFDYTIIEPIQPPTPDTCLSCALYLQDRFNEQHAPIYTHDNGVASICPYRFTSGDGSDMIFPSDACENKADCCQFMGHDIAIGGSVKYPGQKTMCYCGCPPLMHCFSTGD